MVFDSSDSIDLPLIGRSFFTFAVSVAAGFFVLWILLLMMMCVFGNTKDDTRRKRVLVDNFNAAYDRMTSLYHLDNGMISYRV